MWDNILELAISDGLWALLFCVLLIYQLKDSKVREVKYQDTISSLAKDLEYMKELDESIEGMERNFKDYTEELISKLCEEKADETPNGDASQLAKECV